MSDAERDEHDEADRADERRDRVERPDVHEGDRQVEQQVAQDRAADGGDRPDEHGRDDRQADASAFVVPIAANSPIVSGVERVITMSSRRSTRRSSMPTSAAAVATGRYQLLVSAAGTWFSSMSRMIPPPDAGRDADDGDAEQVEPVAVAELRGEGRPLEASDARPRGGRAQSGMMKRRCGHRISEP